MFEKASRLKLRFDTEKGNISAEDLWDVNVKSLNGTFKTYNKELKEDEEESLLETKTAADTELALKVEILRHVVTTKLEEAETRKTAASRLEEKKKLIAILDRKQESDLEGLSAKKIKDMIAAL